MAEPFIGEIRLFSGAFVPRGWAPCDGRLLQIAQNQALFSILGALYGGDARVTFGLPDLRGRAAVSFGAGPGLTEAIQGAQFGTETTALLPAQMPPHTHALTVAGAPADARSPTAGPLAVANEPTYSAGPPDTALAANALGPAGGGQPHPNMPPFLALQYMIALEGIFPARN